MWRTENMWILSVKPFMCSPNPSPALKMHNNKSFMGKTDNKWEHTVKRKLIFFAVLLFGVDRNNSEFFF